MTPRTILPPAWLGVVGGGQLGRMFAAAAKSLGYRVAVYTNDSASPAAQVADRVTLGDYDDASLISAFADGVDALTFEFENIAASAAYAAADRTIVRPQPRILEIAQQRFREKEFLRSNGYPTAPYRLVESASELAEAMEQLGPSAIFKTVASGYDGHGQVRIDGAEDADRAIELLKNGPGLVEGWIDFRCELSVIAVRNPQGQTATYGPFLNDHRDHILDVSTVPSGVDGRLESEAIGLAVAIAETVQLEGVLCVEMFLTRNDRLLVNELAPRPHNSGHLTIEAFESSQFDQQVRTLCGLDLGSTKQMVPAAAMANLLGDLWIDGCPQGPSAGVTSTFLHLYGKAAPRRRRKMGHVTSVAATADEARSRALAAREDFAGPKFLRFLSGGSGEQQRSRGRMPP